MSWISFHIPTKNWMFLYITNKPDKPCVDWQHPTHLRLQAVGQQGLSYLGPESCDMAQPSSENVHLTRTESQPVKNNDFTNKNGAFFKMFQTNLTHKNMVSIQVSTNKMIGFIIRNGEFSRKKWRLNRSEIEDKNPPAKPSWLAEHLSGPRSWPKKINLCW